MAGLTPLTQNARDLLKAQGLDVDHIEKLRANYGKGGSSESGGLMGQFNALLTQREGIQQDKMSLQESQLQKVKTQKNNTAFQNAYASKNNLVDIMRQLLETSRRTTASQQRVFM